MNKVWTSRRFWTLIITAVVDIATFTLSHFVSDPFYAELAKMVMLSFTTIGTLLIAAYTVDDVSSNVTAIRSGVHPDYPVIKE
jgi:hypothetical protein